MAVWAFALIRYTAMGGLSELSVTREGGHDVVFFYLRLVSDSCVFGFISKVGSETNAFHQIFETCVDRS